MASRINKQTTPKTTTPKTDSKPTSKTSSVSSMPPTPKPSGTWITGDNGTPDVYVPPSQQPGGSTTVTPRPPPSTVNATGSVSFGRSFDTKTQGDLVAGGKL